MMCFDVVPGAIAAPINEIFNDVGKGGGQLRVLRTVAEESGEAFGREVHGDVVRTMQEGSSAIRSPGEEDSWRRIREGALVSRSSALTGHANCQSWLQQWARVFGALPAYSRYNRRWL